LVEVVVQEAENQFHVLYLDIDSYELHLPRANHGHPLSRSL